MVEHNLAKVGVASSSLVSRSIKGNQNGSDCLFFVKIQFELDEIIFSVLLLLTFCSFPTANDNAQDVQDGMKKLGFSSLEYGF